MRLVQTLQRPAKRSFERSARRARSRSGLNGSAPGQRAPATFGTTVRTHPRTIYPVPKDAPRRCHVRLVEGYDLRRWIRNILDSSRLALILLLSVSVLVGPSGLTTSAALATMRACGVWCPCEEEQHEELDNYVVHDHADYEGSHESRQGDKVPCPEDCPDCDCCPGLMGGLLPVVVASHPVQTSSSEVHALSDSPAYGEVSGIFRPPRSLT